MKLYAIQKQLKNIGDKWITYPKKIVVEHDL